MFKEQRAIEELTRALINDLKPIKDRFEALFTLRSMMTEQACDCLIDSLRLSLLDVESEANYDDTEDVEDEEERSKRKEIRQKTNKKKIDDALFRHEVAFALGQMRCERAIAALSEQIEAETTKELRVKNHNEAAGLQRATALSLQDALIQRIVHAVRQEVTVELELRDACHALRDALRLRGVCLQDCKGWLYEEFLTDISENSQLFS